MSGISRDVGGSMVEHQPRLLGSQVRFPAGAFAIFFPLLPKLHFQFPSFSLSLSLAQRALHIYPIDYALKNGTNRSIRLNPKLCIEVSGCLTERLRKHTESLHTFGCRKSLVCICNGENLATRYPNAPINRKPPPPPPPGRPLGIWPLRFARGWEIWPQGGLQGWGTLTDASLHCDLRVYRVGLFDHFVCPQVGI